MQESYRSIFRVSFEALRRRKIVFVVVLAVLLVNLVPLPKGLMSDSGAKGWLFLTLPSALGALLRNWRVSVGLVVVGLVKSVLDVVVAQQLKLSFRGSAAGLFSSLRQIHRQAFAFFLAAEIAIYCAFCGLAAVGLLLGRALYYSGVDITYPYLAIGFLLYPLLYALLVSTAVISVLEIPRNHKTRLLIRLSHRRALWRLYLYACARVGVELLCLTVVPFLLLRFTGDRRLVFAVAAIGFLLPLVILRAGSYALTLDLLSSDEWMRGMFPDFYGRLSSRSEETRPSDQLRSI